MQAAIVFRHVCENDEKEVNERDYEAEQEADRCLAAMGGYTKRNPDYRKRKTREWE